MQFHVIVSGGPDLARFVDVVGAVGSRRQAILDQIRSYLASAPQNTNRDVIPKLVWRRYAVPAMQRSGVTTRQMMKSIQTAYCGTSLYKQNVSRNRAARLAAAVVSTEIAALAESDVYWDQISSIKELADEEVFDLTVPGHHNFVAHDIIVHNSIEQDADLVGFIFREEVYKPDREDLHGIAELIIAKQRNGPIGKIRLAFIHKFTKFENLAEDIDGGGDFDSGDE
jgi:replicative DNA helicase